MTDFQIVMLFAASAMLTSVCLLLDPKDRRDASFYGLMASGILFCISAGEVVKSFTSS